MAKAPADMTASELQNAYNRESEIGSQINRAFIDAGRGHERPSETRHQSDPLSVRQTEHFARFRVLVDEMESRKRWHGSLQKPRRTRFI